MEMFTKIVSYGGIILRIITLYENCESVEKERERQREMERERVNDSVFKFCAQIGLM